MIQISQYIKFRGGNAVRKTNSIELSVSAHHDAHHSARPTKFLDIMNEDIPGTYPVTR